MSSGNLTGLAAIVGKKRGPDADSVTEAETATPEPQATPDRPAARKPRKAAAAELAATGAKYTDPDRVQLKAYVRRTTKIDAVYKWQRAGHGDVSDLIEHLLEEYLSTK